MYLKKGIKIMTKVTVNRKNNTIVITKAFEKKASVYGSTEYQMLKDVQNDNPGFTIEIKGAKNKREAFKGLTYEYMEKYIAAKDKDGTIMAEYEMLRGISKEAKALLVEPATYHEMKVWFFNKFPEIEAFHQKREAALEELKGVAEARKANKIKEAEKAEAARRAALKVVAQ